MLENLNHKFLSNIKHLRDSIQVIPSRGLQCLKQAGQRHVSTQAELGAAPGLGQFPFFLLRAVEICPFTHHAKTKWKGFATWANPFSKHAARWRLFYTTEETRGSPPKYRKFSSLQKSSTHGHNITCSDCARLPCISQIPFALSTP